MLGFALLVSGLHNQPHTVQSSTKALQAHRRLVCHSNSTINPIQVTSRHPQQAATMQFKVYISVALLALALPTCLAAPLPDTTQGSIDNIAPTEVIQKPEGCKNWDRKLGNCLDSDSMAATTAERQDATPSPKPYKKLTCDDCFPYWALSIL